MLLTILGLVFLGSMISLGGGIILVLTRKTFTHGQSLYWIAFASGVLLATAFFDLLPEATEILQGQTNWIFVLLGIISLFIVEKLLIWYHHLDGEHTKTGFAPINITIGDTLHNFIDGVVIAATTMVSPAVGLITALAVAAHEIPHEMADFAVLMAKGWSAKKTILINILSGLASLVGAILMYYFGQKIHDLLPNAMLFSAGMFIYLACADLIPELHHDCEHGNSRHNLIQAVIFGFGISLVWVLIKLLEG